MTMPRDAHPAVAAASAAAMRAELQAIAGGIVALLCCGRYFLRHGSDNAGWFVYCDGRHIVFVERCEGRLGRAERAGSDPSAIDRLLCWMSELPTRVASRQPRA